MQNNLPDPSGAGSIQSGRFNSSPSQTGLSPILGSSAFVETSPKTRDNPKEKSSLCMEPSKRTKPYKVNKQRAGHYFLFLPQISGNLRSCSACALSVHSGRCKWIQQLIHFCFFEIAYSLGQSLAHPLLRPKMRTPHINLSRKGTPSALAQLLQREQPLPNKKPKIRRKSN